MTDAQKRVAIRNAMAFNDEARRMASCNSLYMGSMAIAGLMSIFGLAYGKDDGLEAAIDVADSVTLDKAVEYCKPYRGEQRNRRAK